MCNFEYSSDEKFMTALRIIKDIGVDYEADREGRTIVTDELRTKEYDRMVRLY